MWLGKHNEATSYLGTFAETGRLLGFARGCRMFLFPIKVCHLLYPYVMKYGKVYVCDCRAPHEVQAHSKHMQYHILNFECLSCVFIA